MRKSMAAKLAAYRAQTEQALANDERAIALGQELGRRVEALESAVDDDRKVLDAWAAAE